MVEAILRRTVKIHDKDKQEELMRKIPKDYAYVIDFYLEKQRNMIEKLNASGILYRPSNSIQELKKKFEQGKYDDFETYMQTILETKNSIEKAEMMLNGPIKAENQITGEKTKKTPKKMTGKKGTLESALRGLQDGILIRAQDAAKSKPKLAFDSASWLFDLGRAPHTTFGRYSEVEIYLAKKPEVGYDSSTGNAIELYKGELVKRAKTAENNLEFETTFYTSMSKSELLLALELTRNICEDQYKKRYNTNKSCDYDYIMERIFTDSFFKKVFSTACMTRNDILGRNRKTDIQAKREWQFIRELIEEENKKQETNQSLRDTNVYRERFEREDGSSISLFRIGSVTIGKNEDKKSKEKLGIYLFTDREEDGEITNTGGIASNLNLNHIEGETPEKQKAKRNYVADVFMDRKYLDLANRGDNLLYIGIQRAGPKNRGIGFSTGMNPDRKLESQISNLESTILELIAGMNAISFSKDKNKFIAQSRIEWDLERIKKKSSQKKGKIEKDFPEEQEI